MNETNWSYFVGKKVKVIMVLRSGKLIVYRGMLLREDEKSILLEDIKVGNILINKSEISQMITLKEEV